MPDWVLQLIGACVTGSISGIGLYVGVKADLARTHEKAKTAAESANEAHRRIDNILERRRA